MELSSISHVFIDGRILLETFCLLVQFINSLDIGQLDCIQQHWKSLQNCSFFIEFYCNNEYNSLQEPLLKVAQPIYIQKD